MTRFRVGTGGPEDPLPSRRCGQREARRDRAGAVAAHEPGAALNGCAAAAAAQLVQAGAEKTITLPDLRMLQAMLSTECYGW